MHLQTHAKPAEPESGDEYEPSERGEESIGRDEEVSAFIGQKPAPNDNGVHDNNNVSRAIGQRGINEIGSYILHYLMELSQRKQTLKLFYTQIILGANKKTSKTIVALFQILIYGVRKG